MNIFRIGLNAIKLYLTFTFSILDWKTATKNNHVLKADFNNTERDDKFLVYVHWSQSMKPFPGEVVLLKAFREKKINPIIVLNTDKGLDKDSVFNEWKDLSNNIIVRENKGRDLAGYRTGWDFVRKINPSEVYYLNNSIAWLPSKITSFVNDITSRDEEILGITDCEIPTRHIQTYGFASKGKGVAELGFCISKIRNSRTKAAAIYFGEIRLLKPILTIRKFPAVMYPYKNLLNETLEQNFTLEEIFYKKQATLKRINLIFTAARNGTALNPSHFFWLELYKLGFCGVKKDLFKKNPSSIDDLFLAHLYLSELDAKEFDLHRFENEKYSKSLIVKARKILNI